MNRPNQVMMSSRKKRSSKPSKPWFTVIKNNAGPPEVLIYGEIDPFWGLSAEDLSYQMRDITAPIVNVRLNSPGGSMYDGIAIYNIFRSHPAEIHMYVDALAASVVSLILMAANKGHRYIAATGAVMIHNPLTATEGDAEKFRHVADVLDTYKSIAIKAYQETGLTAEVLAQMMTAETWMNADEAIEKGFADEIFNDLNIENKNKFALESVFNSVPVHMRGGGIQIQGPIACTRAPGAAGNIKNQKENIIMHICTKCGKTHDSEELALNCCAESLPKTPTPETPPAPVTPAPVVPVAPVAPVAPVTPAPVAPVTPAPEDRTQQDAEITNLSELHNMPKGWAPKMILARANAQTVRDGVIEHLAAGQPPSTGPTVTMVEASRDKMKMAMRHGLMMKVKCTVDKPAPGAMDFRGMPLMRMAEIVCRENGINTNAMTSENIARASLGMYVHGLPIVNSAGYQPSDLPYAFQATTERVLRESYYGAPGTFRQWTQTQNFPDFRMQNWSEIEGIPSLDKIPPGGTYKEFKLTETAGGWRIYKYGKRITFSWEMIVNDIHSVLATIPRKFGFASDRLVNGLAYGQLTGNAKTPDGVECFDSTHNNLGTADGPDRAALLEAAKLLAWQPADQSVNGLKAAGGANFMGLTPKFVLAGLNNAEELLENLVNDTAVTTTASAAANTNPGLKNPVKNLATPIIDAILDGTAKTATAWFMGADPTFTGGVTIGWLNGVEEPEVIRTENQNVDGVSLKCRICTGVTNEDYRPWVRNAGA